MTWTLYILTYKQQTAVSDDHLLRCRNKSKKTKYLTKSKKTKFFSKKD